VNEELEQDIEGEVHGSIGEDEYQCEPSVSSQSM
jgi:hypothetical protein